MANHGAAFDSLGSPAANSMQPKLRLLALRCIHVVQNLGKISIRRAPFKLLQAESSIKSLSETSTYSWSDGKIEADSKTWWIASQLS